MKKILLFASALAGLFLAGSCQRENLEPAAQGGVTYEISLPTGPQTKGEDGYQTYDLHYEVYKTVNEKDLADLTKKPLFEKTVEMTSNKTTLTLDLLNDQDYTILFWANKKGGADFDLTDLRKVGVNTPIAANNDDRDAFCGMDQLVQHDGAQSKTVELKRPFAQINIATLVPTLDYDVTPTHSYVKVSSIPMTFNVFTGRPADDTVAAVEFSTKEDPAKIPGDKLKGTDYTWVAMNYVLVPESVVEVEYEITTVNGIVKNTIPNVPVQKNYRTNIIGNLLTSNATYTIELKPGFEEGDLAPHPIYLAAANGGEVTLTEDLDLNGKTLEIKGDMSLNLNGKTVTGVMTVEEGADVTIENGTIKNEDKTVSGITSNGNLTLNDVEIESARHAVRVESGKVVINGGTYTVAPVSNSTLHALNVGDDNTEAEVIIKGGKFIGPKGTMADSGSAVNVRAGSKVTIEGGDFSGGKSKTLASGGMLTVKGGSFDQTPAAFVAEGYKVMEKNGKFYVVSEDTDGIVSDKADLQKALKDAVDDGQTDIVIDAEGAEFDMNYGLSKANVPAGTTVTIRNANVNASSYGNGVNGTVIFEDCIFNNANGAYSIHFDNGTGDVIFKNCALYGWNSFGSSLNSVSFENCTLNGNGIYALIRSYANLTLKDCTINTSKADHTDVYSEGVEAVSPATLTEENVKYVINDQTTFQSALDNGSTNINIAGGEYTFPSNVAANVTINCTPGTVFKGTSGLNINGSTVIGATFANEGGVAVSGTIYGTFKDCTFVGEEALRWCYSDQGKDIVFENCVIKTDFRGFHFDGMEGNVVFKNCEINGFNAYGGEGTITFEGCTFGNDESAYNGLNIYSNTVLKNCHFEFVSGKTNFIDMEGIGKTLTIENCTATLDGADAAIGGFVGGSKLTNNTVVIK